MTAPYDKDECTRLVTWSMPWKKHQVCNDPDRPSTGSMIERLADQLESAMAEIERLTRESATLRNQIRLQAGWLEGRAYGRTDEEVSQFAEIKRLRPVVDAMVRVVELDEICDQHPGISDPAGQQAESDLYEAVRERTRAVDAYLARKS